MGDKIFNVEEIKTALQDIIDAFEIYNIAVKSKSDVLVPWDTLNSKIIDLELLHQNVSVDFHRNKRRTLRRHRLPTKSTYRAAPVDCPHHHH